MHGINLNVIPSLNPSVSKIFYNASNYVIEYCYIILDSFTMVSTQIQQAHSGAFMRSLSNYNVASGINYNAKHI